MRIRIALAAGLLAFGATAALAGGTAAPLESYQPDPALRTAPRSELEGRVRRACTIVQARLQNAAEASLERPCGCYAKATLRALEPAEIEAYRSTGYFSESARAKALGALDTCRLPRPI